MQKLGRIVIIIGLAITAITFVAGFTTMIMEIPAAKFFLMLIPVGFLILFTGVVMVLLTGQSPRQHDLD